MNTLEYLKTKQNPGIRELAMEKGMSFPSDTELLMLILGSGTKEFPVDKLSQKVLSAINGSNSDNVVDNLLKIKGMGVSKALAIAASLEFGKRRFSHLSAVINKPCDIVPYIKHFSMESKEHFVCVSLNGAHEIMNIRLVSVGTVNRAIIHPREIFAEPVAEHASAVIVCHNHPYGTCTPSMADNESTKKIKEASDILGITFLDHIIISRNDYYSYLEHGML